MTITANTGPATVDFTRHSAERWSERGRPCVSIEAALANLRALVPFGHIEQAIPTRTNPAGEPHFVLGDYRFPLVKDGPRLLAVTCKTASRPRPGQRLATAAGQPTGTRERRRPAYRRPRHADWLALHELDVALAA